MNVVGYCITGPGKTIIWGLVFVGLLSFLTGIGYFFVPNFVSSLNQWVNKLLFRDEWTFSNRLITGSVLVVFSLIIFTLLHYKELLP